MKTTNTNGNGNNSRSLNITQAELALSYEYRFSTLLSSELMMKYSFLTNSSISSIYLIGENNRFNFGKLEIDLGFSGAYYSSIYSVELENLDVLTTHDSTFYSIIDTSVYVNPLGNDEMKISHMDTSSFTTTTTETRYITNQIMKDNFYSIQFNPSISYTYGGFFVQSKGYLYSILDSYNYDSKLRFFLESKVAYSFKYFTGFSGYNFGEVNILNTDNNRYFSMTNSEDIDNFDYTYYFGGSLHNSDKSLNLTYKFKKEVYNTYDIYSHLIGLGYIF